MYSHKQIAIIGFVLLVLDIIYLKLVTKYYSKQIEQIQGSAITIKPLGVIACYILLIFGLYWFVIRESKSPFQAFILGLIIYGVYDATNYALISKWNGWLAIVDTLWGGTLFSLTTWIVYSFYK